MYCKIHLTHRTLKFQTCLESLFGTGNDGFCPLVISTTLKSVTTTPVERATPEYSRYFLLKDIFLKGNKDYCSTRGFK